MDFFILRRFSYYDQSAFESFSASRNPLIRIALKRTITSHSLFLQKRIALINSADTTLLFDRRSPVAITSFNCITTVNNSIVLHRYMPDHSSDLSQFFKQIRVCNCAGRGSRELNERREFRREQIAQQMARLGLRRVVRRFTQRQHLNAQNYFILLPDSGYHLD